MWYRLANQFSQPATEVPDELDAARAAQPGSNEQAALGGEAQEPLSPRHRRRQQLHDPETDPLQKSLEQQLGEMTDRDEETNVEPENMQSTEGGRGEEQLWRGDFLRKQRDVGMTQGKDWPAAHNFVQV